MNITPGATANKNGQQLEDEVAAILSSHNLEYISQAPYQNIYGSKRAKIDFLVNDLAIECKFQRVAGSVSEKMPYVVANLQTAFDRGLLVIDGDYFRKHEGLQNWLEKTAVLNDEFHWCFVDELSDWLEVYL